jgi:hypothetical protein
MAQQPPPTSIVLLGTEEPDETGRVLRAGPLSVEFQNGQLRWIRVGGHEVLRAIAFIVRDEVWGTYSVDISGLTIEEHADGFAVRYQGRCADGALVYDAAIQGSAGELVFAAQVKVTRDFCTNRTGFVILHPLEGCAGYPVEVEHVDGSTEAAKFPSRISPYQPFFDIRSLKHEFAPGAFVTVRLEGDTFEMEDQRNWTDASFKTYIRPIGLPWPYDLKAATELEQRVSLRVEGHVPGQTRSTSAGEIAITLGGSAGRMPQIGVEIPAAEVAASRENLALIQALGPRLVVGEVLRHLGHGRREIAAYQEIADACRAELTLEAAIPGREPKSEAAALAAECAAAGADVRALTLWSEADLKGVLPGSDWPAQPPLEAVRWAAMVAFPRSRIGGGAHGFFTEFNRRRPLVQFVDYVSFTTTPIVHAADDRSVMETLETLPAIMESAKSIAGGKAWRVGPSGIGTRDNPYGTGPTPNPENRRVCMAEMDPRQRGLFAAAWTVGYLAAFAASGAEAVILGTATGPRGVIYRRFHEKQPWFDDADGQRIFPLFHVVAAAARGSGQEVLAAESSAPHQVAAFAYRSGEATQLVLGNLTPRSRGVSLDINHTSGATYRLLDETTFVAATADPDWARGSGDRLAGRIELSPYAVAFVSLSAV